MTLPKRCSPPLKNRGRPVPNYRVTIYRSRLYYLAELPDRWLVSQGRTPLKALQQLRSIVTFAWLCGWMDGYRPASPERQAKWRGQRLWTGRFGVTSDKRPYLVPAGFKAKPKKRAK
jgi:hypothetical protein